MPTILSLQESVQGWGGHHLMIEHFWPMLGALPEMFCSWMWIRLASSRLKTSIPIILAQNVLQIISLNVFSN